MVERATAPRGQGGAQSIGNVLKVVTVVDKLGFSHHPMFEHFKFLVRQHQADGKDHDPQPHDDRFGLARLAGHRRQRKAYPTLEAFYEDLGAAYREGVLAFYEAGCRYLQFDDVNMAYLCDQDMRAGMDEARRRPGRHAAGWIKVLNSALAARPSDMAMTTHICRGNFKSAWFAAGRIRADR